jgi:hypothetical protein
MLTIGQAIQFNRTIRNQPIKDKFKRYKDPSLPFQPFMSWVSWVPLLLFVVSSSLIFFKLIPRLANKVPSAMVDTGTPYLVVLTIALVLAVPLSTLIGVKNKLHAAVAMCLMLIFGIIITFDQIIALLYFGSFAGLTAIAVMYFVSLILLSVAPAKAVSRRLIFLAFGLLLLIGLNELSKLGLDVTAPKLQG